MYNGIGLLTPRGSGTSGHVTNNKFNLRGPPMVRTDMPRESAVANKGPNKDILDHKQKREVELRVLQEQDRLEAEG